MGVNKKVKERYAELAQCLGMRFDEEYCTIYGEKEGYLLRIGAFNNGKELNYNMVCVSTGVGENAMEIDHTNRFKKEHKGVFGVTQEKHTARMVLKQCTNTEKLKGILTETVPAFVEMLRMEGFPSGCELCGEEKETEAAYVAGDSMCICEDCYASVSQNAELYTNQQSAKKENVVGGVVGALVGSLLGVACIVLLSQMGYVAALSGVVMAVCTLKGYELLGGKLTKKGIIISAVIMIIMTYVGDRLDWAIMIARELETDIFYGYRLVPLLLSEEIIDMASYVGNLVLVYAFLLLGAIPTVRNALRKDEIAGKISKLH